MKICSVNGCKGKHHGKGLCHKHYARTYQTEQLKEYQRTHKKEIAKNKKQYRKIHKEENAKWKKQWREDNKERVIKKKKQYYETHKAEIIKKTTQYTKAHKEQRKATLKRYGQTLKGKASTRAVKHKRRLLESDLTKETVQMVYEDNIKQHGTLTCILCNKPIAFGEDSLEHKTPLSRGGTNAYENLGVSHLKCNLKKNRRTLEEWNLA